MGARIAGPQSSQGAGRHMEHAIGTGNPSGAGGVFHSRRQENPSPGWDRGYQGYCRQFCRHLVGPVGPPCLVSPRSPPPTYTGPTCPTCQYHLLSRDPVEYHRYHRSHRRTVPGNNEVGLQITTTEHCPPCRRVLAGRTFSDFVEVTVAV
jgi:hypothetical protein